MPTLHLLWLLCSQTFSSFPTFRQPCSKDLWVASACKFSKDDDNVDSDDNGDVGKNDDDEDDADKNDDDSDNSNDNANGPDRCGEKDDCEGKTGDADGTKAGHIPGGITRNMWQYQDQHNVNHLINGIGGLIRLGIRLGREPPTSCTAPACPPSQILEAASSNSSPVFQLATVVFDNCHCHHLAASCNILGGSWWNSFSVFELAMVVFDRCHDHHLAADSGNIHGSSSETPSSCWLFGDEPPH